MKDFFAPTKCKWLTFLLSLVYIWISIVVISSFNTTRSKENQQNTMLVRAGLAFGYPALFLVMPGSYVGGSVFTTETTARELMMQSGMRNGPAYPDPKLDAPIQQSTLPGLMTGLVVELLFLYLLACCLEYIKERVFRKRSVQK